MELIMNSNQDFENYQKAKKQVGEIKGFYSHLLSYVLVISVLIFVNLKYSPGHLWFIYTAAGWGIGLFFHAAKVFDWFTFLGKNWEEKKIQQYMEEEKNKQTKYE
jgi:ABC-type transport system involved in cytochrome bd biosynthesis fused ATPase/permease subunit